MKKVKIVADLSIKSKNHQINLSSNNDLLEVNIIGESALIIPFKQVMKLYRWRTLTEEINQKILVKNNSKDFLAISKGNLKIYNYSSLFRILYKSLLA